MKTYFYDRTAYKLSAEPVPNCFLKLDNHFDARLSTYQDAAGHRCVLLAESVCSRMADVEMYAFLMEDARKRHTIEREEDEKAAILTRSFLMGYLGSCRAVLDSSAVTLAVLYALPMGQAGRSFANGDFWHQLVVQVPVVHRRYHGMRMFFNEVLQWCNETVYRVPPLAVLRDYYGYFPSRETQLKVMDESGKELEQLAREPLRVNWIDPLQLHTRWQPQFLTLCEKVCEDIERNT